VSVSKGFIVPGRPHPLLAPEKSAGWQRLRDGFEVARRSLEASDADLLVLYSTAWPSVIGHQIQADPEPVWTHVDEEFHDLGSIDYRFRIDAAFAEAYQRCATRRGLHARTVAYQGFPIDTGSIVALTLLNPDNRIPAVIVSCNMYADRAETLVLGKAARDAVEQLGRRAAFVSVTALSNRMWTEWIEPKDDRVSSDKDDEWNRKLLEFLDEGRLEDASQLMRTFTREANADSKGKAMWWLAAAMGQDNRYAGTVHAYEGLWGTGAAVVELVPDASAAQDQEFDEDDVDVYGGDRNVLDSDPASPPAAPAPATSPSFAAAPQPPSTPKTGSDGDVRTSAAPRPVGPYPHARQYGDLLFVSGMGPRQPGTDAIPGGPVRDEQGNPRDYDVAAQTRATIENIKTVLEAAGSRLEDVVDVTCFLIDMDRDFAAFNKAYGEYFAAIGPTRTTLAIRALPTPIAVELKVIARAPGRS
jgi:2-aminophenol/2-amino-5-chlorophenol 1,6-dioxygenase alpha subunit